MGVGAGLCVGAGTVGQTGRVSQEGASSRWRDTGQAPRATSPSEATVPAPWIPELWELPRGLLVSGSGLRATLGTSNAGKMAGLLGWGLPPPETTTQLLLSLLLALDTGP